MKQVFNSGSYKKEKKNWKKLPPRLRKKLKLMLNFKKMCISRFVKFYQNTLVPRDK